MNLKVKIPESQQDITLNQYQQYLKVIDTDGNKDTFFLKQKCVEIFCKIPLTVIYGMKKKDVDNIFNTIMHILADEKPKFEPIFKVNDVEFGFHPDFEEMTAGEYVDLTSYIKDWQDMHKAMAVLYRPIELKKKGKYTITEYTGSKDYAGMLKDLPLNRVVSAVFFLISSTEILIKDLKVYLQREMITNPKLIENLTISTAGMEQSFRLLEETFLNSMRLQI